MNILFHSSDPAGEPEKLYDLEPMSREEMLARLAALCPADPDAVKAAIEAAEDPAVTFRNLKAGGSGIPGPEMAGGE